MRVKMTIDECLDFADDFEFSANFVDGNLKHLETLKATNGEASSAEGATSTVMLATGGNE